MTEKTLPSSRNLRWPTWLWIVVPLLALAGLLGLFTFINPAALFTSDAPPIEDLAVERIVVIPSGFRVTVFNNSQIDVTIAQVAVDDAFWVFDITPSATLPRFGQATLTIPYPWVAGEPHVIMLVTNTGTTFEGDVAAATLTPTPGLKEFAAYGLLGIYVGIIPVALGMLWFPAMKQMGRRGLNAILALTIGMLVFLLIDTLLEAFELGNESPGVFQGVPLALFAALLTWLALLAVGSRRQTRDPDPAKQRLYIATLIALGIGLHNLGEGLVIGSAYAQGEAALGAFLVIGFTLHNVTEGIGIVAPVTRDRPALLTLAGLVLLAGAPAILGTWIGGFAFSPVLATLFFGVGAGAIWQVIVEVGQLLRRDAERDGVPVASWLNVGALLLGIALMYFTAFLVK